MTQTTGLPTPLSATSATSRKRLLTGCILIALLTAAVYWPVAKNGFINFDDPDYVTSNPLVQKGLTAEGVRWAFTSYHSSNWHPVTWLSHMLDCQLYGLKPAGHHITNVTIHILNTLLLFGLLNRLTGAFWRSAIAASLFALHPLHVESVAWASERKDVLSGFFFILTLLAYVRYVTRLPNGPPDHRPTTAPPRTSLRVSRFTFHKWLWYSLALFCFALGLMSKPMLVTLPFVLLLLDFWPLKRLKLKIQRSGPKPVIPLLLEKLPFLALALTCSIVTFRVQHASGAVVSLANEPFATRLANALIACGWYVLKTFWPVNLAAFYPHPPLDWMSGEVLGSLLLLLTVSGAAFYFAVCVPYTNTPGTWLSFVQPSALFMGWFWFLGMLVPVIGFIQVGKQAWADRYTYLPHIGLFIAIVWNVAAAFSRLQNRVAVESGIPRPTAGPTPVLSIAASCGVLAACAFLTFRQISFWRNDKTLFEHAAAVTTGNFVAYGILANTLVTEKKWPEAIELCQKAITLSPGYTEAYNTLGIIYTQQGKDEEALASYRQALQTDPAYPDAYSGLGALLNRQKNYAEAEAQCRKALQFAPLHVSAMFNLASALHNQGKLDEAANLYRQVLETSPGSFEPQRYLGNVLLAQGKAEEAIPHFQAALRIRPNDMDTHVVLGMALLDRGKADEATAQFLEAVRLQPTNSVANYQLALVRQNQRQLREAITCYRNALAAQPDWPELLNNFAWLLASNPDPALRNGPEAVTLAERACKITNEKEPLFLGTLAAAYAEAGRFTEAIGTAEKASSLAAAAGLKEVADKNTELLTLYRSGKPFHESQ
jgi:tetratricopeptide (TPR) repeat protein